MRVFNNASYLFFNGCYSFSDVAVFNDVDAATGAPSGPATGAPPATDKNEDTPTLDSLKQPVEDIQGYISTLQQMGATNDANQQQSALESKIGEFKKSLDGLSDSCQSLIIKYRQEGVPNFDQTQQQGAPGTDPASGGAVPPMDAGIGAGAAPGMDMGMGAGAAPGMDMGMGMDMGAGAMPPANPGMGAAPQGAMPAPPAGASVPGMTTYDDLNQQGVTGPGGSTAPVM